MNLMGWIVDVWPVNVFADIQRERVLVEKRRKARIRRILIEQHDMTRPGAIEHVDELVGRILQAWEDEIPLS